MVHLGDFLCEKCGQSHYGQAFNAKKHNSPSRKGTTKETNCSIAWHFCIVFVGLNIRLFPRPGQNLDVFLIVAQITHWPGPCGVTMYFVQICLHVILSISGLTCFCFSLRYVKRRKGYCAMRHGFLQISAQFCPTATELLCMFGFDATYTCPADKLTLL